MGNSYVEYDKNNITINKCHNPSCVSDFLHKLKSVMRNGYTDIIIHAKDNTAVYPNACVPIRGIIDYYSRKGIDFTFDISKESYLSKCGFVAPLNQSREELQAELQPFGKLFYYEKETPGQVADITQAYVNAISNQFVCGEGVLHGLNWCISEVMDNVFQHSQTDHGFVMGQYHQQTHKVVFCIYDAGIGIYNSLKSSKHKPASELDAISLSLQEGISDGEGQGNGLFGLYQIILGNKGTLAITSGATSVVLNESGEMNNHKALFISNEDRGTIVDFQLDLSKNIDMERAFETIGGLEDFEARIDEMLNDDDFIEYSVMKNCQGTGTRTAGMYLRNDVENIIKRTKGGAILDFSGVNMVSSSFIDEFVAKMVVDLGFIGFNHLIRIENMEPNVKFLCERSLYMRIHDMWSNKKGTVDLEVETNL